MSLDGTNVEAEGVLDPADAAPAEPNNAQDAAAEAAEDEAIYNAAFPEGELPPEQPEQPAQEPEPQPEPVQAEQPEPTEPVEPEISRIDLDKEYLFVEKDGTEHRVKGSDVAWLTPHMHKKVQEAKDELAPYKALEQRFEHDKGGLVKDILSQTDLGESLTTIGDVLRTHGLTDIADQIQQRMQQSNVQFDPLQKQQTMLQQQQADLAQQQAQLQAQALFQQDLMSLQAKIKRPLTPQEQAGVDNVFSRWSQARQANPSLERPTMEQAYKSAVEAIKFEQSQGRQTQQPPPQERVTVAGGRSTGIPDEGDLYHAAMREMGLTP